MEEELNQINIEQDKEIKIEEKVQQQTKKSPKKVVRYLLVAAIALLLLSGATASGYFWRDQSANNQKKASDSTVKSLNATVTQLKKQLADADSSTTTNDSTTTQCTAITPTASVKDNIKASVTSGNTAALEGYMASSVYTVLAASEFGGSKTPAQAVTFVTDQIKGEDTWDFNLSASVLSTYGAGSYTQYFPSTAIIGKSASGKVISFTFACNGKISGVFVAASDSLL
ncbi:hypothetical protein HGB25_02795 [Candidatus Saccharibacteria bacterium]|nr:hypothetical protein [Candidatus Saccharibacteria bacterium]